MYHYLHRITQVDAANEETAVHRYTHTHTETETGMVRLIKPLPASPNAAAKNATYDDSKNVGDLAGGLS